MVLCSETYILHTGFLGKCDPFIRIKVLGIEILVSRFWISQSTIFVNTDSLIFHIPLPFSRTGIQAPMNKHTQLIIQHPLHLFVRLHRYTHISLYFPYCRRWNALVHIFLVIASTTNLNFIYPSMCLIDVYVKYNFQCSFLPVCRHIERLANLCPRGQCCRNAPIVLPQTGNLQSHIVRSAFCTHAGSQLIRGCRG